MERKEYYCDYCGVKITSKRNVNNIKTPWYISITDMFSIMLSNTQTVICGDGCNKCYTSYNKWVDSRRR